MNEDWEGEDVLDINHPNIPKAVRQHGRRFKNPARYVIDVGEDGFVLYAEDGELLDVVYLTEE